MSEFIPNPNFLSEVERAVLMEMDDLREEMYQGVKRRISPASITDKTTLRTTPPKRTGHLEVGVFVGYGRGLGPIFESGTKPRYTKGTGRKQKYPAGLHRGQITTANHAMRNARDAALRRGITFRYL